MSQSNPTPSFALPYNLPPPNPIDNKADIEKAQSVERKAKGRASTILTGGGLSDTSVANTASRTLLGT